MKKKIAVILAAVCVLSVLGGCGDSSKKENKDSKSGSDSKTVIEYNASDYVTLGEYKGIQVSLNSNYEVTEEDVKSNIESMLSANPAYEDSDKTNVENGDFVNIDYEGLKDGVAFEGGSATDSVLQIGSGKFIDGFESGLIGAKTGDKVSLNLTFPEDYQQKDLAGQPVVFQVTVNKIVNKIDMTYDGLNDDYVKNNLSSQGYDTVEALKAGVKSQMEKTNASQKDTDTQNAILTKLKEVCKVDKLPDGLLDQRVKEYKEQMLDDLKNTYNMELKDYLSAIGSTEEEFNTQIVDYMQENLEAELIVEAIAKKESIEADEDGFSEYVDTVVSNMGYEDKDALIERYGEDYVKNIYINTKTLKFIQDNAVISYGVAAGTDGSTDGAAVQQ